MEFFLTTLTTHHRYREHCGVFLVVRYCSYVSINEKNVILGGFQLASDASFVNNYTS